jgi:quinol monooxygenase YgiN
MSAQVKITAVLNVRTGQTDKLTALLVAMAPLCRAESGNLRWDVWQDEAQADRYVIDELYVDDAAVAAHHRTPHYQHYLASIGELADRTALTLTPLIVASVPR